MRPERFTREFYLIVLIDASFAVAREMYQPVLSLYLQERGASPVEIGAIVSIFPLAVILVRFLLGPLSDKLGIGWFLLMSLGGQPITLALFVLAPSISWFYSIQILSALTVAVVNPLLMSLVLRIAPMTHRGDAMGRYLTAAGLSTLLGPGLSSFLLGILQRNYGGIFVVAIVPAVVSLMAFLFVSGKARLRDELFTVVSRDEGSLTSKLTGFVRGLRSVFMAEGIAALTVSRIAFSFTLSFFKILFPLYAVNGLGYNPSSVALIFTIYGLLNTLARFPSGRLSDRVGRKLPLLASIVLMVAVNLGFSSVADIMALGALAALYGASHGMRAVSEWTLLGDSVSPRLRGLANSYLFNVFDMGTSFGAIAGGVMATAMPISAIFQIAAATMAANAIAVGLLTRGEKPAVI